MPYSGADDPKIPEHVPESERGQWAEVWNDVYTRCVADGGESGACETSAFQAANGVVGNKRRQCQHFQTNAGNVRRETMGGREWIVVPVAAIAAGVLNGSLVPLEEIATSVPSWNGRPVVVDHPKNGDDYISANAPNVAESYEIGRIYNARLSGHKMLAEIWIDANRAEQMGGDAKRAADRLAAGTPTEVSTAYWPITLEEKSGTLNGRQYSTVQRGLLPDHLAILLDADGACNWRDGCGAPRVNSQENEDGMNEDPAEPGTETDGEPAGLPADGEVTANAFRRLLNDQGFVKMFRNFFRRTNEMEDQIEALAAIEEVGLTANELEELPEVAIQALADRFLENEEEEDTPADGEPADGEPAEEDTPAVNTGGDEEPDEGSPGTDGDAFQAFAKAFGGAKKLEALLKRVQADADQSSKSMIEEIAANSDMTAEELDGLPEKTLTKIHQTVVRQNTPLSYLGRPAPVGNRNGDTGEEVLSMPELGKD